MMLIAYNIGATKTRTLAPLHCREESPDSSMEGTDRKFRSRLSRDW